MEREQKSCVNCESYIYYKPEGFLCGNPLSDKQALEKAGSFRAEVCEYFILKHIDKKAE